MSQPSLGVREQELLLNVLESNQLTHGPRVAEFEQSFAEYLRVKHAVMCSSGTTALHLALSAIGVHAGDEILVPDLSFVATANAVTYTGATPVLCDIDPDTWAIDLDDAARQVTERTRAIVVVHLYGQPANMDAVKAFANRLHLMVIEDAAEALGGFHGSRALGTIGHLGTFSFYGNKALTTGEGGCVVTNDLVLAERARLFRGQGQTGERYYHSVVGFNYRMTEMQAAIGLGQLESLDTKLERRRIVMAVYQDELEIRLGVRTVKYGAAPWLFTFLLPLGVSRDRVVTFLGYRGIDTRPVFIPMHRLPMYLQKDEHFPVACDVGTRGLSLPTYPQLTVKDVQFISGVVSEAVETIGVAA